MSESLTLTVLGCDGSHPGPGGEGSGYLVRDWSSSTSLWLDAGPGTFAHLLEFTDALELDAIVLSHSHDDHWSDLQPFITAARWTMGFDRDPVPVYAPPGLSDRVLGWESVLDWHQVDDGAEIVIGGLELSFSRTQHPVHTLAVRLSGAAGTVGYSADSGPGWPLHRLGRGLDLVLCEATYTEDFEEDDAIHMSGTQAGRAAKEAGAKRLVVTHRWATIPEAAVVAEAATSFGGRVDSARVGRGFSL